MVQLPRSFWRCGADLLSRIQDEHRNPTTYEWQQHLIKMGKRLQSRFVVYDKKLKTAAAAPVAPDEMLNLVRAATQLQYHVVCILPTSLPSLPADVSRRACPPATSINLPTRLTWTRGRARQAVRPPARPSSGVDPALWLFF